MARLAIWARERPDTESIALGGRALGWDVSWHRPVSLDLEPADVVVVLTRKGIPGEIAAAYEARGVPVLVFDLPPARLSRMRSWRALWPGRVNRLPEPDYDRAARIGLVPGGDRSGGSEVLLCGQAPDDAAHGLDVSGLADWYEAAAAAIRKAAPDLTITWRPHPLWVRSLEGVDRSEHPDEIDLERALDRPLAAVVSYNSTCGIVAMLAGHRVLCDPSAFYAAASQGAPRNAGSMRPRNLVAIRDVLAGCAAVQWSPAEIETGAPLVRALEALEVAA